MGKIKVDESQLANALNKLIDYGISMQASQVNKQHQRETLLLQNDLASLRALEGEHSQLQNQISTLGISQELLGKLPESDKSAASGDLIMDKADNIQVKSNDITGRMNILRNKISQSRSVIAKSQKGASLKAQYDKNADASISEEERLNITPTDSTLLEDPFVKSGFNYTSPQDTMAARRFGLQMEQIKQQNIKTGLLVSEKEADIRKQIGITLNQNDEIKTGESLTLMATGHHNKWLTMSTNEMLEYVHMDEESYVDFTPGEFSYHNLPALKENLRLEAFEQLTDGIGISNEGIKVLKDDLDAYAEDGTVSDAMEDWANRYVSIALKGLEENRNYTIKDNDDFQGYEDDIATRIARYSKVQKAKTDEIGKILPGFFDVDNLRSSAKDTWNILKERKEAGENITIGSWDTFYKIYSNLVQRSNDSSFVMSIIRSPEYRSIISSLPEGNQIIRQIESVMYDALQYTYNAPGYKKIKSKSTIKEEEEIFDFFK